MKKRIAVRKVSLLITIIIMAGCASGPDRKAVMLYEQYSGKLEIANTHLKLRYDEVANSFNLLTGNKYILENAKGRISEGRAVIINIDNIYGRGQAIEIKSANGDIDTFALYRGRPFLFVQSSLSNPYDKNRTVNSITPLTAELSYSSGPYDVLDISKLELSDGKTVDCITLTSGPDSKEGLVAGWLTQNKAYGTVHNRKNGSTVKLRAESRYDPLVLKPYETDAGEMFVLGFYQDIHDGVAKFEELAEFSNKH